MKNISLGLVALLIIFNSCNKDESTNKYKINDHIVPVILTWQTHNGANIPCAVWNKNNAIMTVFPLASFQLNESFQVIEEKIYDVSLNSNLLWEALRSRYIRIGWENHEYLIIKNTYDDFSCGSLRIFNAELNTQEEILDSTYNISSAAYYRSADQIIYYSYGKPLGNNPGYYLLDRTTGEKTLLLAFISDPWPGEYVNGFDVHPTQNILLVPFSKMGKSPRVVEYDFKEKTSDTLNISFDLPYPHVYFWLRYNQSGEKILYSCYPGYSGGGPTGYVSEIGIIQKSLNTKTILDVNTDTWNGRSENICPHWSPDEKHIIYSSAPISKEGRKGLYAVYMYKNISLP